jgi:hypothetical protein
MVVSRSWATACADWELPAYIERQFGLVGEGVPAGYKVVEREFSGQVFVRELPTYARNHGLVLASAFQAWQYVRDHPRAQFEHPLAVGGEGAMAFDQHELPQVLSFSCTAGRRAVHIHRQGVRLGANARLLVLEKVS